jgi:peptidoglycan/LPS O-acetylase OafA/YrhL
MIGDIRYLDSGNRILNNVLVALVLVSVVAISYVTYSVIEVNGQKVGRYLINAKQKKIPAAT